MIQKLSINSARDSQQSAKQQNSALKQKEANKYEQIENCPSPEENFTDWLKYQKTSWRKIRKDLKEDKKLVNGALASKNKHQGLNSFIRNMDEVVLKSTWHIL